MSFKQDVERTPNLNGCWRAGMQALKASDAAQIDAAAKSLCGSVDIDTALRRIEPTSSRWDYVVAQLRNSIEFLHWIEVHPASGGQAIREIAAKHAWLKQWIDDTPFRKYKCAFVWISSGRCAFHQNDPKIKSLAAKGIRFCGRHLKL